MAFSIEKLPGKSFFPASSNLMLSRTAALGVKNCCMFWSLQEFTSPDSSSNSGLCQPWVRAASNGKTPVSSQGVPTDVNSLVNISFRALAWGKSHQKAFQEGPWLVPQKTLCGLSLRTLLPRLFHAMPIKMWEMKAETLETGTQPLFFLPLDETH